VMLYSGRDALVRAAGTAVYRTAPAESPLGAGDGDSAGAVAEEADDVDDRTLVKAMLDAEDGRMRQSEIVEVTGWSKAKVSRLLSRMAGDGEVAKIQLGRENLICLDRAIPAAAAGTTPPD
jgi:uncharacterized membrane protein